MKCQEITIGLALCFVADNRRQKYKLSERNAKEIGFFCFSATLLVA